MKISMPTKYLLIEIDNFHCQCHIYLFMFSYVFKAKNSVKYYAKKFKNVKQKARQRDVLVKKQLETGGGTLTKAEQKIVQSQAYADLATKLGISAFGNVARTDSDASSSNLVAPTNRLKNILSTSTCMYISIFV